MSGSRASRFVLRLSVTLALLTALIPGLGGAQARPRAEPPFAGWVGPWTWTEWAGTWEYKDANGKTFGTLVLTQPGAQVTGEWTPTKEWAAANAGHPRGEVWKFECTATERHTRPPSGDPSVCRGRRRAASYPPGAYASAVLIMEWDLKSFRDHQFFGGNTAVRVGPVPPEFGKAPPTTTKEDTSPPEVVAFPPSGVQHPGSRVKLGYAVKDDSGRAKATLILYDGGTPVARARSAGLISATGSRRDWNAPLAGGLKGPLFFCVRAEDAAGNRSPAFPWSTRPCAYISLLVDIAKVSNGCGGAGWQSVVAVQNYFGNTGTYYDFDLRLDERLRGKFTKEHTVDFRDACNLHDAGYGGQTVKDEINGGIVDYHDWSRLKVDDKFNADMKLLCLRQLPPEATIARSQCGVNWRYTFVRSFGYFFFDADWKVPGAQRMGPRSNR